MCEGGCASAPGALRWGTGLPGGASLEARVPLLMQLRSSGLSCKESPEGGVGAWTRVSAPLQGSWRSSSFPDIWWPDLPHSCPRNR